MKFRNEGTQELAEPSNIPAGYSAQSIAHIRSVGSTTDRLRSDIPEDQQTKEKDGKKSITPLDSQGRPLGSKKRALMNKGKRAAALCKAVIIFLLSRVGLTVVVVAYVVLGGFLFQYLEGQAEVLQRKLVVWKRSRIIAQLWNLTADLNLEQKNWSDMANDLLKEFQDDVYTAVKDGGWNGREENDPDLSWSFAGSLLFCTTVLTTIGYGNIAPKTVPGRVATMLYALPGIPLTLLWLSLLGSSWATCFIFFYKIFSGLCARCVYGASGKQIKRTDSIIDNPDRVPLYVSLLVIVLYIAGGSLLFTIWEEDWDYLIAMYFCFITLTTIGFGDYVFGVGKELNSNAKLITSSVYLAMGLAIIAMCFNLMQEEATVKIIILGRKLGLIQKRRTRKSIAGETAE